MTHSFVTPEPPFSLRRTLAQWWDDPDSRSLLIGILGMIAVHLLLFFVAPHLLHSDDTPSVIRPHSSAREFNIELASDPVVPVAREQPKPPAPFKFVETNPNAPENIPDKTENFGAQNQQAAQEKPQADQHNDRPAIEGQKEIHSTQIVSGQLVQHTEQFSPPVPEETTPQKASTAVPQAEQNPLSGFEKMEGDNPDAFGTNLAKQAEGARPIPQHIDGVKNAPLLQGATVSQPQIDPKKPRPRPSIVKTQQVRPAIFEENKFGTANIGPAAYDARWSNYGQYLQKMIETIQIQWERILIESKVYPTSGTNVSVKFKINSDGAISEIIHVEGTAGNQAEKCCTSAITERAPYGPWTDDMIAMLGTEQEMTFTFYYQ